jgi:hypothetical protein
MEAQVNELLQAWRICKDRSVRDPSVHANAFNYIEKFKQSSPNLLDIGFLLVYQKENFNFGLQLITHTIKFRWNDLNETRKSQVKQRLMDFIVNLDDDYHSVKICLCPVIIELIKREYPLNWPTLHGELFAIHKKSGEHKKLVFLIYKYMAKVFKDIEASMTQMSPQRYRDTGDCLSQNMRHVFFFHLKNLESSCHTLSANDQGQLNAEFYDLTNSCLDSLSNYINWIGIEYISINNCSIVTFLLPLLNDEKLCKNAAKCLAGLANRKGNANEPTILLPITNKDSASQRKPLLCLFSASALVPIMDAIKISLTDPNFTDRAKYLVEILTGMGQQLNYLWNSAKFAAKEKPACLNMFLEAVYQLLFLENRLYSLEAVLILNQMLQNKFIRIDTGN